MQQKFFSQRLTLATRATSAAQPAAAGLHSGAAWAAGLLWLAAGLSAGGWFLQAMGQGSWTPVQGVAESFQSADSDAVARALGASVAAVTPIVAPALNSRLQLLGVVTQGRQQGVALITVDGQPPRPWQVGAVVTDGLVLQSVERRAVQLGKTRWGPTTMELTMPHSSIKEIGG